MDLRITQQPAQIGLDIKKPAVKLDISMPRIELQTGTPELEIQNPQPAVYIDQTQCRADMGKRKPEDFCRYYASVALSEGLEGIASIAREGEQLADIVNGTTVASVITSKDRAEAICNFTVASIPHQPPEIEADTGAVEVDLRPAEFNLNLNRGVVENDTSWANVEMYLLQKAIFDIQWVGSYYDIFA